MTDTTIANVILRHLGGQRFLDVTGARITMVTSTSVAFRWPVGRARNKPNRVRFILSRGDRFTMELFTVTNADFIPRGTIYGLEAAQLLTAFEQATGIQVRVRR